MAPDHPDLPIEWIELEVAGQSTARNAGLARATGDTVLFIDDDDEIEPDLIERHLSSLRATAADVSSGVVHEPDSGALSAEFQQFRVSDTFPTNNSMVRREALDRSGWFDEAYDRGERADHDLGMRLYLSGSSMVLEPSIDLLHHHAPRGGLRVHNARAVTRGSTRKSVRRRTSLSPSQIYLWNRYFRADQVSEAILLFMSSNLASNDGPLHRRLARVAVQAAQLPAVRREVRASIEGARVLAEQYPRIPGENLPLPPHAAPTGPQPAGATAEVAP